MSMNEKVSDRKLISVIEESAQSPETLRVLKQIRLLFALILATSTAAAVFSFMSVAGSGVALYHRPHPHPHHGEFGMMPRERPEFVHESEHGRFGGEHNDEFEPRHGQFESDFAPKGPAKPCKKGRKHGRPAFKHDGPQDEHRSPFKHGESEDEHRPPFKHGESEEHDDFKPKDSKPSKKSHKNSHKNSHKVDRAPESPKDATKVDSPEDKSQEPENVEESENVVAEVPFVEAN